MFPQRPCRAGQAATVCVNFSDGEHARCASSSSSPSSSSRRRRRRCMMYKYNRQAGGSWSTGSAVPRPPVAPPPHGYRGRRGQGVRPPPRGSVGAVPDTPPEDGGEVNNRGWWRYRQHGERARPKGIWGVRWRMIRHSDPYTYDFEQCSRLIAYRHHCVFPRPISNPTHPRHFLPCWVVVSGCGVISTISQAPRPRQTQVVEETADGLTARVVVVVVRARLANSPIHFQPHLTPLACRGEGGATRRAPTSRQTTSCASCVT